MFKAMDCTFFYMSGYQRGGGKKRFFWILWAFVLVLLCVILMTMFFSDGGIKDNHYIYVFVIVAWLVLSPLVKPKGIEVDSKNKTMSLVSLIGNYRMSKIRISDIVSLELSEEVPTKLEIVLVDGSKKLFYIYDRTSFVNKYNELKNKIKSE